ncbi:MAG: hypothetical protein HOK67_14895 [Deltaproteobacteria bacterium]|nr:hypothetical protein [Deltaproteobacteria bacterium]
MDRFNQSTTLGRTGLKVGRLGVSSSFGAPAAAYEAAFERGCNYFTWGTFIKGRSSEMKTALKNIILKGQRDKVVLSMFTNAHNNFLTERFFDLGLKSLGIEYADVLLLGYYSKTPVAKLLEGALRLKEQGKVRFIGISSHNRRLFPELTKQGIIDIYHVRYNAAHRGAETEVFPYISGDERPGVVSFTATCWRKLLNRKKMPQDEEPMSPEECYRFVLSNPAVDICMMGARNRQEMEENLNVLDMAPFSPAEMERANRIGDYLHR